MCERWGTDSQRYNDSSSSSAAKQYRSTGRRITLSTESQVRVPTTMAQVWLPASMLLLGLLGPTGALVSAEDENGTTYRLPITVLPSHYMIRLVPYFEERNFTFDGEVEITVNATIDADSVTLHYNDMDIVGSPTVESMHILQKLEVVDTTYDNITNFFKIELNENLRAGQEYLIRIKFVGKLNDDMAGFYKCSYNTSDNETRWMAVTQFEPTDARRAFPCFDEPALKARFQVNIARTQDYHSISNMPRENSSEPDPSIGGRIWDSFIETPPMSTYLVAFVVSDLKNLSTNDGKYSVWMREDVVSQGKYALSIAPTIIKLLENYTEIMYELPKLDQVAVPDLFFWAMENWGLVTMWEGHATYKEGESKTSSKQDTLLLVAHELAHFWFGDLVSPKWWNYLWLNEGFATYYEYMISAKMEADWLIEEQFVVDVLHPALSEDSLNSSHPITNDVYNPEQINSLFDVISYDKAGSVIRSMEHFLTQETMRKGLSKYLKENSHGNTEADDLFKALDDQQKEDNILPKDMDVKTIMDSWTLQPGYPVIHMQRMDREIHVAQERFLLKRQNVTDDTTWWVPISYTKGTNSDFTDTKPKAWLKGQPELRLAENIEDTEWIILNIQSTGFYRVNYDPITWSLITKHLKSPFYKDIHVLNRAQLLNDAFSLSRAGLLNYTTALELSTYLTEETHPIPWSSYANEIFFIKRQLYGTDSYDNFKGYVLALLNKLYDSVGFKYSTEESHVMKMIQPTVTFWACTMGHKDCVTKALEMFSIWMEHPDNNVIPPDVKEAVYCTAVRSNKKMWEFLWDQYQLNNETDEKWSIYEALGCTEDEALLKEYLSKAISDDSSEYELEARIYYVIHSSPRGVDSAINFLSENFKKIFESLDHESSFGDIITAIASHITTRKQAEKIKTLLAENNLSDEAEEGNWIPETTDDDIAWNEKHHDSISIWLKTFLKNMS